MSADHPIAIIDDDQSVRTALGRLLRSLGYAVRSFATAEDFLGSGTAGDVACIITDIQMPGMSGIELKRHLSSVLCMVPVIMVTARSETAIEEEALASGAVCLLRKPFAAAVLIECLTKALGGHEGDSGR